MRKLIFLAALCMSVLVAKDIDPSFFDDMPFVKRGVKVLKAKDLGSIYFLSGVTQTRKGETPVELFVTKDKKYFVFGVGFDAKTNERLTLAGSFEELKKKAAMKLGSGKDEYLLFTDPECPYCKKLEEIIPKLDKKATFYVFFYPLPFHKNASAMSEYILALPQDKRADALYAIQIEGDDSYKNTDLPEEARKKARLLLKEHKKIAQELLINGTPTVLNNRFKKVKWTDLPKRYGVEMPIDMRGAAYLSKLGGKIVLGEGVEELNIVMDTECPHCIKMFKEGVVDNLKTKYRLNFFLYPGKKRDSRLKTAYLLTLDGKDKAKRFEELMKGKSLSEKTISHIEKLMTKDKRIMKYLGSAPLVIDRMGINAVPTVFDSKGNRIDAEKMKGVNK